MHQTTTVKDEDEQQQTRQESDSLDNNIGQMRGLSGGCTTTNAANSSAASACRDADMATPPALNCCAGCGERIRDKFIFSVIDLHWHQDCVQCVDCSLKLNERCYTYDGKLYCKLDYFRRFGPKCFACREPISRNDLVQKIKGNRVYHLKCFTCNDCHRQLKTGEQMHLIDGKRLLCNSDYHHQLTIGGGKPNGKSQNGFDGGGNGGGGSMSSDPQQQQQQPQQTYYTLMSNQQQHTDKKPPSAISRLELDKLDQAATKHPLDNNLHSGGEDDDEPADGEGDDELEEDEFEEEEEGADYDGLDDDDSLMRQLGAAAGSGEIGRLLAGTHYSNGSNNLDNNNVENEENRSLAAGALAVGHSRALKKNQSSKQVSHNQRAKLHGQLQANGKRKRRRKQKGIGGSSSGGGGGAGRVNRSGGAASGKKLANRNGESILNGMSAAQAPAASQGSILAASSVHHASSLASMPALQSGAGAASAGAGPQQQPISNPHIKSVSSSAASTASNSSTSSSLASLGQQQQQQHHQHHSHPHQQQHQQQNHHNHHHHHHHHHHQQQQQQATGGQSAGHKPTRVRTVLNEKQLQTLRDCYQHNPRPDALMKERLVDLTGLSPRVIRVWFQNKRCKDKKKSILYKQMQQHEKDGRHLAGLTIMRGVQMVASSPIQYDDHSTVSSTAGPQQQQPPPPGAVAELQPAGDRLASPPPGADPQQQHRGYAVHSPASLADIHAYQPPWSKLIEYAHRPPPQQQAAGGAPPLNPASPRYQQLIGQIHGYNSELQAPPAGGNPDALMVDPQTGGAGPPERPQLGPPFGAGGPPPPQSNPSAGGYPQPPPGSEQQQQHMSHTHLGLSTQPAPVRQQQQPLSHLHQFQQQQH